MSGGDPHRHQIRDGLVAGFLPVIVHIAADVTRQVRDVIAGV